MKIYFLDVYSPNRKKKHKTLISKIKALDAASTVAYPHASPSTTSTPALAVPHCSKWEDRGTMRGLGINFPHHVSSAVSNKELASRALAEISALRRKSGGYTRFPDNGVDQTSVLVVS